MLVALVTVGLLAAALLGLIWSQQRRLIYFPWPDRLPPASSVLTGSQEIVFATEDGIPLGGWFLPADRSAQQVCRAEKCGCFWWSNTR